MKKILLGLLMLVSVNASALVPVSNDYHYTLTKNGAGTFSGKDFEYNLDFGTITQNSGDYIANFVLTNKGAAAFDGSFSLLTGSLKDNAIDFTNLKYNKTNTFAVTFSSVTSGNADEVLHIRLSKLNCNPDIKIHILGNIVSPVPEEDTWAMMILGIGMIGFAVRKK